MYNYVNFQHYIGDDSQRYTLQTSKVDKNKLCENCKIYYHLYFNSLQTITYMNG